MALTNCKIVVPVVSTQSTNTQIDAQLLSIVPDPGFTVAASDFTDNTLPNTPDTQYLNFDILDSGKPCSLSDATTAHAADNTIIVKVHISPAFSITSDTNIVVDIDGKAKEVNKQKPTVAVLVEEISTLFNTVGTICDFSVATASDVTYTKIPDIGNIIPNFNVSAAGNLNYEPAALDVAHQFEFNADPGVQIKLATITLTAQNGEAGQVVSFESTNLSVLSFNSGGLSIGTSSSLVYGQTEAAGLQPQFSLVPSTTVDNYISTTSVIQGNNFSLPAVTTLVFDLMFTMYDSDPPVFTTPVTLSSLQEDYAGILSPMRFKQNKPSTSGITGIVSSISFDTSFDIAVGGDAIEAGNVPDKVPSETSDGGGFIQIEADIDGLHQIIPDGGIKQDREPIIIIAGTHGTQVTAGITQKQTVNSGAVTSAGAVTRVDWTDANDKVLEIPQSGKLKVKLPVIEALTITSGYVEYELKIKAETNNTIKETVVSDISKGTNLNSSGSEVVYTFRQYAKANIIVQATIDTSKFSFVTSSTIKTFAGTGTNKLGVVNTNVSKISGLSNAAETLSVTVDQGSGTIGLNDSVTLDSSLFVPSVANNGDIVEFSNISIARVASNDDKGILTFDASFLKIGSQDQVYTVDLNKLFIDTGSGGAP